MIDLGTALSVFIGSALGIGLSEIVLFFKGRKLRKEWQARQQRIESLAERVRKFEAWAEEAGRYVSN